MNKLTINNPKIYNRVRLSLQIFFVMLTMLACTISTVTPASVNMSYVITERAYKRATLAKPPAPVLDNRGEKRLGNP